MRRLSVCCAALAMLAGCSRSNNLLLGRVEATVGTHLVVVTDCYRTSVPPQQKFEAAGQIIYRFTPCRDADVLIRGEELTVNAPYPSCHANLVPCLFIHLEELVFKSCTALDNASVCGK